MHDEPTAPPPPPTAPGPETSVVRIVSPPPRFGRSLGVGVAALGVLTVVFALGFGLALVVVLVAGLWVGTSSVDETVLWRTHRDGGSSVVAILPVRGVIDDRQAAFVRACVDRIEDRGNVDAVVLRVESPGGGVTASDEIAHEVERLRKTGLPVIASYGSVAASGGYYVSCGSDFIMAQETSITGSIGVIAQVMTFEGLMEKVGVEPVTLVARRSPEKSIANDAFRAWTDEDRAQITGLLDDAYDTFRTRVRDGRGRVLIDLDRLDDALRGGVYTAREALERGLVDGIGYLDDAIARAEQAAGVTNATVLALRPRPTLFGELPFVQSRPRGLDLTGSAETIRSVVNDLSRVRLMYLAPVR
jgi:protease-4